MVECSRPWGRGFEPHWHHCVVVFEQDTFYPSLVLVQPRKTRPCLTEGLFMGRKESNQTNKQKFILAQGQVYGHDVLVQRKFYLSQKTDYHSFREHSGRMLDSRRRDCGFDPQRHHCVVVLEQDTFILA